MKVSDFDFSLPRELIAQSHAEKRSLSRLLVYHFPSGKREDKFFYDIEDYFSCGDLLVINDTKVIPARLFGQKKSGGRIELLLTGERSEGLWESMARPLKRLHIGTVIEVNGITFSVEEKLDWGGVLLRFPEGLDVHDFLQKNGRMPVPPYIHNDDQDYLRKRYQTVFAEKQGSVAAPTAGLHFTEEILCRLKAKGVQVITITLHVGMGTFLPVKSETVEGHVMHSEFFEISPEAAEAVNSRKGRLFACGTTVTRTLEYAADENGRLEAGRGWSDLFIYPGYRYRIVENLITNFHLPRSTLLMLVAALTGRREILQLYQEAVAKKYRFFSFGDAMLIITKEKNALG
jgi:S-adenosylmethionine:tRNA ribosyltransferase-isomerase